ncbi:hypothetical protein [Maribellus sp. YY47]|uniref:hypothetical protein n=1 Tax=Maribellus sp. YY47 TaxID=2929486 RepID=UPI002001A436|nr:hypothetical protein [Maribellus sp. YY47]MCK3683484.1 hypothetical protein [Maribellus sp. YY47]
MQTFKFFLLKQSSFNHKLAISLFSIVKVYFVIAFLLISLCSCGSDSGVTTDDADTSNTETEVVKGLDITQMSDVVSICYSVWFNNVYRPSYYNITEILKSNPLDPQWGPVHAFHYWAEPAVGYYNSDNVGVIKTHLRQLNEAKVDFIILDFTNGLAEMLLEDTEVLCNTALELRQSGEDTPGIVFWCQNSESDRSSNGKKLYDLFYKSGKYDELFVYWSDKPFLITTQDPTDSGDKTLTNYFTCRKMWGLQTSLASQEWSFLQDEPQNVAMSGSRAEQISVSVAHQETYISYSTATTRNKGKTFQEQWRKAFTVRPKVVTLTWWNEWMAQRFVDENGGTRFVDNYTREASRDIEPMKGGHGDLYYQFMKTYIDAYKSHNDFPENLLETENYD